MSPDDFERRFGAALLAGEADAGDDPLLRVLVGQPGFAVYRNTVLGGCIDALAAGFPAVLRLVGDEWFRAAAAQYVRAQPPRDGRLLFYGEGFPAFLDAFGPARELPYLGAVARLDRCWIECHAAADEPVADAAALQRLDPAALAAAPLRPHAAARWAWFPGQPVFSLWSRNREQRPLEGIAWQGEGALLTRPDGAVRGCALDAAGCALLDALAAGRALGQAAAGVLDDFPGADLAALLALLLRQGALVLDTEAQEGDPS